MVEWKLKKKTGERKRRKKKSRNELFGPRSPFLSTSRVQSQPEHLCVWASSFLSYFSNVLYSLSRSSSACLFYLPRESNERVHREDAGHLLWRKRIEKETRRGKKVFFLKFCFFKNDEKRKWRFFVVVFFLGLSERVNILCCCVCAHGKLQPFLLNRRTIKEMRIYPLTKEKPKQNTSQKRKTKNSRLMMSTCWLVVCGDPGDPTG